MKAEIQEWYDLFEPGQKVLTRVSKRRGFNPAFVVERRVENGTASVKTKEVPTGNIYYTMYGLRKDIKHACQEEGCWSEAIACRLVDYFYRKEPAETIEWFCAEHCQKNGYCYGCGEFYGGVEDFEVSKTGLCDSCRDELEVEIGEYDEYENYYNTNHPEDGNY